MVTSEARIATDRPERYLAQICQHASAMGGGGHGARMHAGEHQAGHDLDVRAEWSDARGTVTFTPWGTCRLAADGSTLTLLVEATDNGALHRIQAILGDDLDRFGRRDGLVVSWQGVDDHET